MNWLGVPGVCRGVAARLAMFSLVGVANTAVGVSAIVGVRLAGAGPLIANVAGYSVGLIVSYALNSKLTFAGRTRSRREPLRFAAAFVVAFACNITVVALVGRAIEGDGLLVTLSGTPVYVVAFYALCEWWVFPARRRISGGPPHRPASCGTAGLASADTVERMNAKTPHEGCE